MDIELFKSELQSLLIKHGANLDLLIEGDTHGVNSEGIGVNFALPPKEDGSWGGDHSVRLSHGYGLYVDDLQESFND